MSKQKLTRAERKRAEKKARRLLQSPRFFNEFLLAMKKAGLVGEELNALVLFIVVVSRILAHPLNAFVKGASSSGKNFLVKLILLLMPRSAVREITSASAQAWHYSRSDFRHRVVYLQEQNEAAGAIDPIRQLISEGKLVRIVPKHEHGKLVTKERVAYGPVAAISTTTKDRLKKDDESRHISIRVDQSKEQTRQIVRSYTKQREPLSRRGLRTWHTVHRLLEDRVGTEVVFPEWFEEIPDRLFVDDLSVRRYYPAFIEGLRTVCLIRSFQPGRKLSKRGELVVEFADFAITALIFDSVFAESLYLDKKAGEATRRIVESIARETSKPVCAKDVARKLKISMDTAYRKLRSAQQAGVIRLANKPEKSNRKKYWALPAPRFVPDPKKLFRKLRLKEVVSFVHPITGEQIVYKPSE